MSKVYWCYVCDFGHEWFFYRDEHAIEDQMDTICPYGHEAVHLQKWYPANEVKLIFEPAAVIMDKVKKEVIYSSRYKLVIEDRDSTVRLESKNNYPPSEITHLARKFMGLSKEKAWELWQKLGI